MQYVPNAVRGKEFAVYSSTIWTFQLLKSLNSSLPLGMLQSFDFLNHDAEESLMGYSRVNIECWPLTTHFIEIFKFKLVYKHKKSKNLDRGVQQKSVSMFKILITM